MQRIHATDQIIFDEEIHTELSAEEEAHALIERAIRLIKHHQAKKVGVPFYTDDETAQQIQDAYRQHQTLVDIRGSNKIALTMQYLQQLLKNKYSYLQSVIDFLPLTIYANLEEKDQANPNSLKSDMSNIRYFIKQGGILLDQPLLIDEWLEKHFLEQQQYLQDYLNHLRDRYPSQHESRLVSIRFSSFSEANTPVQLIVWIDALFQTLINKRALLVWPLHIVGMEWEQTPTELKKYITKIKKALGYAVTKTQKEQFIVKLIKWININIKVSVDNGIKGHITKLPKHLQELFNNENHPHEIEFDDIPLYTNYLNLLNKYIYERENIISDRDLLFEQRKEAAKGLHAALKQCQNKGDDGERVVKYQEIIEGVNAVYQALRDTHSHLLPILKALPYEIEFQLENKEHGSPIEDQLEKSYSDLSNRLHSRRLINEVMLACETQEEKIRALDLFSRSFDHVGGNLKKAVNHTLHRMKDICPYSPVHSLFRDFIYYRALALMEYVVEHEQDKEPFFATSDKDFYRHVKYASQFFKKLFFCKTKEVLKKIADEAQNMHAVLKAHHNIHTNLLGMFAELPQQIDHFLRKYDLPSEKKHVDTVGDELDAMNVWQEVLEADEVEAMMLIGTYPNTELSGLAKSIPQDHSQKSIVRQCAMIDLFCGSQKRDNQQLGHALLLKVTPEYIEQAKRIDPDCYYAQLCLTQLDLLNLTNNVNNEEAFIDQVNRLRDYLKQYIHPNDLSIGSSFVGLMSLKKAIENNIQHKYFSFFSSPVEKNRIRLIHFLNEFVKTLPHVEKIEMQSVIKNAEKNEMIAIDPDLNQLVLNKETDFYHYFTDTISTLQSLSKEITWDELKYTNAMASTLLLNYLSYTVKLPVSKPLSVEALAILAILKESVPEKICGCEIKRRLNQLYDSNYVSQVKHYKEHKQWLDARINIINSIILSITSIPVLKSEAKKQFRPILTHILNDPEELAGAINARASIDAEYKITANDLNNLKEEVNFQLDDHKEKKKGKEYIYTVHDKDRLGSDLSIKVGLSSDVVDHQLSSYQKIVYEAAIFETVVRLTVIDCSNEIAKLNKAYNELRLAFTSDPTLNTDIKNRLIKKYNKDQANFENELMRLANPVILDQLKDNHLAEDNHDENKNTFRPL